jgi:hypothetical protein
MDREMESIANQICDPSLSILDIYTLLSTRLPLYNTYKDSCAKRIQTAFRRAIYDSSYQMGRTRLERESSKCIQTAFRRAISDPSYQMCRNRLMREFKEGIF